MEKRDKRNKFVDLAEKRTQRAIKDIRLLGNLANSKNYSYTEEDVRKITKALQDEITDLKRKFEAKPSDDRISFSLD